MRAFVVKMPSGSRYWTVLDERMDAVPVADKFLRELRFGRDRAESTTKTYAGAVALHLRWCSRTDRDWTTAASEIGLFMTWLKYAPVQDAAGGVVSGPGATLVRGERRINRILVAVRGDALGSVDQGGQAFLDESPREAIDGLRIRQDVLLGISKHAPTPRILRLSHPQLNRLPRGEARISRLFQPSIPRSTGVPPDDSHAPPGIETGGVRFLRGPEAADHLAAKGHREAADRHCGHAHKFRSLKGPGAEIPKLCGTAHDRLITKVHHRPSRTSVRPKPAAQTRVAATRTTYRDHPTRAATALITVKTPPGRIARPRPRARSVSRPPTTSTPARCHDPVTALACLAQTPVAHTTFDRDSH